MDPKENGYMNRVFNRVEEQLMNKDYSFEKKDFERPWGGFWVIDSAQSSTFVKEYFPEFEFESKMGLKVSPKILLVAPGKRLSWQYHHRRSELWRVVEGKVGVVRSNTDDEGAIETLKVDDQVRLEMGERHRLVGLEDYGVVAEIWIHEDASSPSDEDDIVRLQDDFDRKTPADR